MGVDYSAHRGLGVKIQTLDLDENEEFEYFNEWLEENMTNESYSYFEVGQANYEGGENDYYLVINEPLKDGFCALGSKADEMLSYLKEIGVDVIGSFGVVGGLEVW